jgi:hypothetical protein
MNLPPKPAIFSVLMLFIAMPFVSTTTEKVFRERGEIRKEGFPAGCFPKAAPEQEKRD